MCAPIHPPPQCPVPAVLSSESRLEKCRTSSAELSLRSCWCHLLCPPPLLSPRLLPAPPFVLLRKVNCCHLLVSLVNTIPMPVLTMNFSFLLYYQCLKLNCVTLQEFPSSQQPLQPHHAAAGLVGWSCHTPIQPDAQCGSCTCHEAALNQ